MKGILSNIYMSGSANITEAYGFFFLLSLALLDVNDKLNIPIYKENERDITEMCREGGEMEIKNSDDRIDHRKHSVGNV